jgi:phasin protein
MEFAKSNMEASFGFAHKLSDVKSPSDFLQLATEYPAFAVLRGVRD